MPLSTLGYTRVILNGIPYWKDTDGTLYYYESSVPPTAETRIALGSETTGLFPDWQERGLLSSALQRYREEEKPRVRIVNEKKVL